MMFEPLSGRREVMGNQRRTRQDFAGCLHPFPTGGKNRLGDR
jgi:hypothetical protein